MLEFLIEIDRILFVIINTYLANPVTNAVMPIVTAEQFLKAVLLLIVALLLWKGDKRQRWLVLFCAVTILITDQLSSNFLKHLIERSRPCHTFTDINLLVPCGGGYSMPSSHAANVFGVGVLISNHVRRATLPLMTFAVLVALSRVFVGVHYPADIMVGAFLGTVTALIISWLFRKFDTLVISKPKNGVTSTDDQADDSDETVAPDEKDQSEEL